MGRGSSEQGPIRTNSNLKPGAVKAERSRLRKRRASLTRHSNSLDLAVKQFGDNLDLKLWEAAFYSEDPADTNKVLAVTASFSTIVNNYVEALKAGSKLMGLYTNKRRAAEALQAVVDDKGLTATESTLVQSLYVMEGRIQHISPDVKAKEVRDAILALQASLPKLITNLDKWLGGHLSSR